MRIQSNGTIIGHDDIWRFFTKALTTMRLANSYILAGPSHVGKETLARRLIRLCWCTSSSRPCGLCKDCQQVIRRQHPLLIEIQSDQSTIGVEEIRGLRYRLLLGSQDRRHRFVLIKDLALLSKASANVLLKLLEEPPKNTTFISITRDFNAVLPTIQSRSQILHFSCVGYMPLLEGLRKHYNLDRNNARRLAELADGRPGLAIAALLDEGFLERYFFWRERAKEDIDRVHRYGILPKLDKKTLKRDVFMRLRGLESVCRETYYQQIMRDATGSSRTSCRLRILLLRIAKAYTLLDKNINPALVLDQIYCN